MRYAFAFSLVHFCPSRILRETFSLPLRSLRSIPSPRARQELKDPTIGLALPWGRWSVSTRKRVQKGRFRITPTSREEAEAFFHLISPWPMVIKMGRETSIRTDAGPGTARRIENNNIQARQGNDSREVFWRKRRSECTDRKGAHL